MSECECERGQGEVAQVVLREIFVLEPTVDGHGPAR